MFGGDDGEGRVSSDGSFRKKLATQEIEMIGDWKNLGLMMKVLKGASGVRAGDSAQALVLSNL